MLKHLCHAPDPGQVDHALEIGRALRAELPGEMLPAHVETTRRHCGVDGLLHVAEEEIPCLVLQRLGESQHTRGISERPPAIARSIGAPPRGSGR